MMGGIMMPTPSQGQGGQGGDATWMRGLMWRHARQVARRRSEAAARNEQFAALGLRLPSCILALLPI